MLTLVLEIFRIIWPYKSYYSFADRYNHEENLPLYMENLEKLTSKEGAWTLPPLVASGANEPTYPTIFHFSAGGAKGDERFEWENLIFEDMDKYRAFYEDVAAELENSFEMKSDHQRYHNVTAANLLTASGKKIEVPAITLSFVLPGAPAYGMPEGSTLRKYWQMPLTGTLELMQRNSYIMS